MSFLFWDTYQVNQACFSYGYTKPNKTACPVVYVELISYNKSVQILIQMYEDRLQALNLTAILSMCL